MQYETEEGEIPFAMAGSREGRTNPVRTALKNYPYQGMRKMALLFLQRSREP